MPVATNTTKDIALAVIWFALSTAITWYFIYVGSSLYNYDAKKMLLSCSIAGAKWAIQIAGAFIFLADKRWLFIRSIGFTCFAGSCILLPFCIGQPAFLEPGARFLSSLITSVAAMILLYYRSVRITGVSVKWYLFWLLCLTTAVSLQLTVVFHVL